MIIDVSIDSDDILRNLNYDTNSVISLIKELDESAEEWEVTLGCFKYFFNELKDCNDPVVYNEFKSLLDEYRSR